MFQNFIDPLLGRLEPGLVTAAITVERSDGIDAYGGVCSDPLAVKICLALVSTFDESRA